MKQWCRDIWNRMLSYQSSSQYTGHDSYTSSTDTRYRIPVRAVQCSRLTSFVLSSSGLLSSRLLSSRLSTPLYLSPHYLSSLYLSSLLLSSLVLSSVWNASRQPDKPSPASACGVLPEWAITSAAATPDTRARSASFACARET